MKTLSSLLLLVLLIGIFANPMMPTPTGCPCRFKTQPTRPPEVIEYPCTTDQEEEQV